MEHFVSTHTEMRVAVYSKVLKCVSRWNVFH